MEKLSRPKLKGKENEKQWEYRQITLTCFASLWQCSCHYKGRCKRFSFKCLRVEHQQQFHRKAPLCIMTECTKVFCKENPQNKKIYKCFQTLQAALFHQSQMMEIVQWLWKYLPEKVMRILAGCNAPCRGLSKWPTDTREIYIIRRAAHGFCY